MILYNWSIEYQMEATNLSMIFVVACYSLYPTYPFRTVLACSIIIPLTFNQTVQTHVCMYKE